MPSVVITGVSGNFGSSLAKVFLEREWRVIGTARSSRPTGLPDCLSYRSFDASRFDECRTFWNSTDLDAQDRLCLVNNAGNYFEGRFMEQPVEAIAATMESCYSTAAHMTRALMETRTDVRIMNVISDVALVPSSRASAYTAAKAAMSQFFHSLQAEFEGEEPRITNLYPGPIASSISDDDGMDPIELASFVETLASFDGSFYVKDCTVQPALSS